MLHINSSLLEQAMSLLEEHNIKCVAAEAPACATLSFYGLGRDYDETLAENLLREHFGDGVILGLRHA